MRIIQITNYNACCAALFIGMRHELWDTMQPIKQGLRDDCRLYLRRPNNENALVSMERALTGFNKIIIIAHNMQGYDGHYSLRHMHNNKLKWQIKEDSLVMNGTKILKIAVDRFTFLDSLNYFMAPLSKLPSMFKIDKSKGYYSHYFNKLLHILSRHLNLIPEIL